MNDHRFLLLVKKNGFYRSQGEASRATNAVFGTIKSWLSPAVSDELRKILPQDASRLWQYSPASFGPRWAKMDVSHLILRIQQLGRYTSSSEAQRAFGSVMDALSAALPVAPELIIGKSFPREMTDSFRTDPEAVAV